MYNHIIVAVDDSATSAIGLDKAIELARLNGARLEIVHAVDESVFAHIIGASSVDRTAALDALVTEGQECLDRAIATAEEQGQHVESHLLSSETQHVADQIADHVAHTGADLLVVGSHGRRGFQHLLLGSVAEKLMRKVSVSVLIVRD
ncbi:MAG: universal stress protein [Zoogloeaceae bacterium]|nr:universal stress protein [Rhodocyclaceae bacterium]MCP5237477.1 universal stress protein [Zoogloeaceae bacterium]